MAPPRDACSECGSMKFIEEDGKWYCHKGHEQEGGQQIGEDDGDFGKTGKINRQKAETERSKVPKVQRGVKGFHLFLKAWQHILWRQCYTLIHQYGLPKDLWSIVRELWELRAAILVQRSEKVSDEDENPEKPPDVTTTSESDTDGGGHQDSKLFKTGGNVRDNPILSETIALNYLGILIMQLPTRLSTLYRYIREEQIPYIRAIRYVPRDLRDRLAPEYRLALDTTVIPKGHDLQLTVYKTAVMYGHAFEMRLPTLNWISVLIETLKRLALPLEVYPAVKSLAGMLNFQFKYPEQHASRRNATTYPEVQVMALVVVATKLLYPFDSDSSRVIPESPYEAASMKVNWNAWFKSKCTSEDNQAGDQNITPRKAIEITDADILQMQDSQLDQYMDWFQETYVIKDMGGDQVNKQILAMFPLQDIPSGHKNLDSDETQQYAPMRLKDTQARLERTLDHCDSSLTEAVTVIRPGQHYQRYTSLKDMSEPAASFHQEAATLACISVEALLRACLRTERLLLLHQHEQKRAEYFGEAMTPE